MDIIDISDTEVPTYCRCLEDWSEEMREAGDHKRDWYARARPKGLRVKLARDDDGKIVGMIHYAPPPLAPVAGVGCHYVYCVWVHAYKEGVGDRRKQGIGSALLAAAEEDARALGSKGLAAWGLRIPVFMRSAFFKRRGYRVVDRDGMIELVWKPFVEGAEAPRLLRLRKKPEAGGGRVRVTCLRNGWCPAQDLIYERARKAAAEFPRAEFVGVETEERSVLEDWGAADALFLDDRQVRTGPPPTLDSLRKLLAKAIKRRRLG